MRTAATSTLHRARGFTLVEVVVAMALLSLVMLVLGSSIRSMGASAQRIDTRTATTDEMRVAASFLREIFGRSEAQRNEPPGTGLLFSGASDGVSWIGVMPPRFGAGGRYFFRLKVETVSDGSTGLVLRFQPWRWEQKVLPDWSQGDSRVLLRNVDSFALAYGGDGMELNWLSAWPTESRTLPPRVRMLLVAAGSQWPPLVFAVHPLPSNQGGGGRGFVTGSQ